MECLTVLIAISKSWISNGVDLALHSVCEWLNLFMDFSVFAFESHERFNSIRDSNEN